MKKLFLILVISLGIITLNDVSAQCGPTDHSGADWIISSSQTLAGSHINIGLFKIEVGVTVTVDVACHFFEVEADTIIVYGVIDADGVGEAGGAGGAGGAYANGSGVPGTGGYAGLNGYGSGAGVAGDDAGNGGTETQICGGLFCSGNRDGTNGGGGGAGGGSGASYGGIGGVGGYGAFGSGFTNATGGDYGSGGSSSSTYGTETGTDITWGSGGAGAGGGGGSWGSGTTGGSGGAGGGMLTLKANYQLIMSGEIYCNGDVGGDGGNGGGESTDGGNDCSTSGYDACGLCSESVYDAAGGSGGGAAGGSGGGILLQSDGEINVTGILEARGGIGGTAGQPNDSYGACFDNSRGGAGAGGGRIKIMYNPCVTANILPTYNVNGGSGGNGMVSGNNGSSGTYRGDLISSNYVDLDGGIINLVDPVFCDYGDVPPITSSTTASGGIVANYSYQWQYSSTDSISGFVNLPGQTSLTCDPSLITLTTWYRRQVNSGSCAENSNVVKASVIDCSAIDEDNIALQIQVYPNPNLGDFIVKVPHNLSSDAIIRLYNSFGQIISEWSDISGKKEIAFNLNLAPGLYFITLDEDGVRVLSKIAIQ